MTSHDVDNIREILDVATDVLRDYGPDFGDTRIERLARFVALNVRAEVTAEHAGSVSLIVGPGEDSVAAVRVGNQIGLTPETDFVGTPTKARELATALMMVAFLADRESAMSTVIDRS